MGNIIKEAIQKYNLGIKDILNIKKGNDFINDKGEKIPNYKLSKAPYKSRSFAYCSDTKYKESIVLIIKKVDVLYHEATFAKDLKEVAEITGHSTSEDAANIAIKAKVQSLLIGHFSTRYKDTKIILDEAKALFKNTHAVNDGDKITISLIRGTETPKISIISKQ